MKQSTIIVKGIPQELWIKARQKALGECKTMKEVLIQLLHEWTGKNEK